MIACPLVIYGFVEEKRLTDMSYKICVMKVHNYIIEAWQWEWTILSFQDG